nr:hypothetical protein L203_05833 [Cryptococcus depauperatus CBS 7841]
MTIRSGPLRRWTLLSVVHEIYLQRRMWFIERERSWDGPCIIGTAANHISVDCRKDGWMDWVSFRLSALAVGIVPSLSNHRWAVYVGRIHRCADRPISVSLLVIRRVNGGHDRDSAEARLSKLPHHSDISAESGYAVRSEILPNGFVVHLRTPPR